MRGVQTPENRGKKARFINWQVLEMAYKMVSRVEGLSAGVGRPGEKIAIGGAGATFFVVIADIKPNYSILASP